MDRYDWIAGSLDRLAQEMAISDEPIPKRFIEAFRDHVLADGWLEDLPDPISYEVNNYLKYYFGFDANELDEEALVGLLSNLEEPVAIKAFYGLMSIRDRIDSLSRASLHAA